VSFNIEGLHHDLVSALLDHLFGIQNRAGCSCAGPYGHRLLNIDRAKSESYRKQIARGFLGIKPGWVRLSLPYYASASDLSFILEAIEFVADHGHDFVPSYRLGWLDGVWRHMQAARSPVPPRSFTVQSLERLAQSSASSAGHPSLSDQEIEAERAGYFAQARQLASELRERWAREKPRWNPPCGRADIDELIWFEYVHADNPFAIEASPARVKLEASAESP